MIHPLAPTALALSVCMAGGGHSHGGYFQARGDWGALKCGVGSPDGTIWYAIVRTAENRPLLLNQQAASAYCHAHEASLPRLDQIEALESALGAGSMDGYSPYLHEGEGDERREAIADLTKHWNAWSATLTSVRAPAFAYVHDGVNGFTYGEHVSYTNPFRCVRVTH